VCNGMTTCEVAIIQRQKKGHTHRTGKGSLNSERIGRIGWSHGQGRVFVTSDKGETAKRNWERRVSIFDAIS